MVGFKEETYLLVGRKIGNRFIAWGVGHNKGSSSFVGFDHKLVYDWEDSPSLDVIGFWHSHPSGAGDIYSMRDVRTMHAWTNCLGRPLLCAITCEDSLKGWWFSPASDLQDDWNWHNKSAPNLRKVRKIGRFFYGTTLDS